MRRGLIFMAALTGLLWGQLVPSRFSLNKAAIDSTASYMVNSTSFAGLASNSILDIRAAGDSLLFFGTSRGLSLTPDLGITFRSYVADQVHLPEGGISALATEDTLIVAAGIKDTVIAGSGIGMGTGLAYSTDLGGNWTYKSQPKDESSDTTFLWAGHPVRKLAVTTAINNITYDVAVSQGTIWTASWAGGLRRYHLPSGPWTPVPLPRDNDTTLSCDEIPEDYVLNPRSVAVVGASSDSQKELSGGWVGRLTQFGSKGKIYPINPTAPNILGIKAYPSITNVPGSVDYAIIAVPSRLIPEVLGECVIKGVKVVHIFTADYYAVPGPVQYRPACN